MFFALIKNEYIKLFSKKKTYIVILLFVILLGIIVAVGEASERSYKKHNDPDYLIKNYENQISYEQQYIEGIKNNTSISETEIENQIQSSKDYIESLQNNIESLKQQKESETKDAWIEDAKDQIESLKTEIAAQEDEDQKAFLNLELERLETHLKHNIPLDAENYNTGVNHLYLSIGFIASLFLAFGLVLFNADNISGEYNPGTLKFLLIQPVTRIKVLLSKYIVMVTSSLGLILGIQLVYYVGVGLVKGFGSFYRPMLINVHYEKVMENGIEIIKRIPTSGSYISLGEYLLRMFLLEALFIITMTAFIYMVSTVAKSSVISMTVGIGALLGTNILYNLSTSYRKLSYLIFIHFTDLDNIVSGRIVGNNKTLNFTYSNVVIISIVTTILFITVASIFFKKRDILI